jgi:hypothetical protein
MLSKTRLFHCLSCFRKPVRMLIGSCATFQKNPIVKATLKRAAADCKLNIFGLLLHLKWLQQGSALRKKTVGKRICLRSHVLLNEQPVYFICGLPRSGTTFLNEVLTADVTSRSITYPDLDIDMNRLISDVSKLFREGVQPITDLHPLDKVAEDLEIMMHGTVSHQLQGLYGMESAITGTLEQQAAFWHENHAFLWCFLQKMPSSERHRRFLLKSPFIHVVFYPWFSAQFPSHRLIITYRSLRSCAISWCQLLEADHEYIYERVDPKEVGKLVMIYIRQYAASLPAVLAHGFALLVSFERMVQDPITEIRKIYQTMGWDSWNQAEFDAILLAQAHKHRVTLAKPALSYYGLDADELRTLEASLDAQCKDFL